MMHIAYFLLIFQIKRVLFLVYIKKNNRPLINILLVRFHII